MLGRLERPCLYKVMDVVLGEVHKILFHHSHIISSDDDNKTLTVEYLIA